MTFWGINHNFASFASTLTEQLAQESSHLHNKTHTALSLTICNMYIKSKNVILIKKNNGSTGTIQWAYCLTAILEYNPILIQFS